MGDAEMVTCPYNKAHRMLRKKLQHHLIKCRDYYKDEIHLLECPFNKSHMIPEPEFYQHVKSCVDRKIVDEYVSSEAAPLSADTLHAKIEADENWDDENVTDYDPKAHAASIKIVREPRGLRPSQRKAFIKEERKRWGDLSDEEEQTSSSKKQPNGKQRYMPYKSNRRGPNK